MSVTTTATAAVTKPTIRWILVTGQPGCGKTTAVQKMTALLQSKGISCQGFYTEEVRDRLLSPSGARIGFDVVTVTPQKKNDDNPSRGILARVSGLPTTYKTGKYLVDVDSFEKIALPALAVKDGSDNSASNKNNDKKVVYVLDEIGRMELHSKQFPDCVRQLLTRGVRLIGAITATRYGHRRVPFCDEIASHPHVQVYNLTKSNREEVLASLLCYIEEEWINGKN